VSERAARQHGVVAARQLYELGLTRWTVARWCRAGWLVRLYPAVYAFGHAALTLNGRRMAWALAAGPDADLSHRTAGAHHGVFTDHGTRIHVTTPRAGARGLPFFVAHQRRLHPQDRTELAGIPVTTLERTFIDIAATERPDRLAKAFERAEELNVLDLTKVRAACDRNRGQRGVGRVRALLEIYEPQDPRKIRSRFEQQMLKLLEHHGFPRPLVNLDLHGWEADLYWPQHARVVELDGWQGHRTKAAFERDHERDLRLEALGYGVGRISWLQFRTDRPAVLAALRRWLPA
jgi:predicted transcriptional regulator of viral defense system/very-short-patch-repair endonuclease